MFKNLWMEFLRDLGQRSRGLGQWKESSELTGMG